MKQQDEVDHVTFSPVDPQHVISISGDKTWEWDLNGQKISPTYNGTCQGHSHPKLSAPLRGSNRPLLASTELVW